jgi:hypothetical protein
MSPGAAASGAFSFRTLVGCFLFLMQQDRSKRDISLPRRKVIEAKGAEVGDIIAAKIECNFSQL